MAAGLFILRVTLKSGSNHELGYEDSERARAAAGRILASFAGSAVIAQVLSERDDFGRDFSVPADRVDCCCIADFGAELMMGMKVESMRSIAKQQVAEMQARRQQAGAKLLVPSGPVPMPNGGFRAG